MRFRKRVGTLLLVGLIAACGGRTQEGGFHPSGKPAGDGSSAGSSASSGAANGATDPNPGVGTPAPKTPQSALAAYRAYQRANEQAYENNDPNALKPVAMDPILTKITKDIASVRADGLIWRFHNVINPQIQGTSTDGSTVVVLDCVETLGAYKYSAKTGKRIESFGGGTFQYQATMRYSSDIWKISDAAKGEKC